ncbi:MAG: sugar phosphate isomerase/epimerase family protein, partial [Thermodesulfobacteriota bacterium]
MQLSFSTNAFVKHSVFEAVERIASVGYKGVELLADIPHLYADSVTEADLERLKALLDRTELHVANINANTAVGYYGRAFWEPLFEPSLAHPDSDLRRWRIDYSKKCVDIAASLGAPTVSITSGRPVSGILPTKSMVLLHGSLQELLEYAAERSVRIGIEYEPGLLVERYEELAALIEAMDSPHLGANLDLGHSHVLGEDPEIVIRGLGSRIFHVHIEDIKGTKHYHLIPGTGDMDFPKLLATLTRHGYEGFVTVELYTYPDRPEQAA